MWLNAGSELRYPNTFVENQRVVYLKGEAYFDVTKDRSHPFIVKTISSEISVLGTSFNVNARENSCVTTLVEGRVRMKHGIKDSVELRAGQQLSLIHISCVEQAIRIIEAGGKLVRITAPGVKEAKNLENIHAELRRRGYTTPLCADIHFNPEAAIEAAKHVEKVRINPGNFVDKRATFKTLTYTDEEYAAELERLREKFTAFLDVCREYGTAVRIGTNHVSLSCLLYTSVRVARIKDIRINSR